ncbi:SEC-C metal-binding domain-containing protein [Paenibacillus sp. strain BS8-2]
MKKIGRNDPCHCGSGLKYKKCCLSKDEATNVIGLTATQPLSLEDKIDRILEWPSELHQAIAHHFIDTTRGLYRSDEIEQLLGAWNKFAIAKAPVTKKIGVYPSALEYLLCQMYDYNTTQAEIAKKHEVSATTLSQRANQIYDYLVTETDWLEEKPSSPQLITGGAGSHMKAEQTMAQLHALIAQQNFNSKDEVDAFLKQTINKMPQQKAGSSKEEQAAELLYKAWEEPNRQRKMKLAQDALQLDPSNANAYNVMAECATSAKDMAYYYKQGMLSEEKRLGEAFFEENKGHFWMYMPTRPYMRAKKGYAEACAMMDNMVDAIKHYRELLELNPNDNQGVRDLLLPALIEIQDWNGAEQLSEQFKDDGTAAANYSRVLVEYGLHGNTPKLTKLIKEAYAQNPFVPPYLLGKKKLPHLMPEYIGFGDDREAIVYAQINYNLWMTRPQLLQLLPKK